CPLLENATGTTRRGPPAAFVRRVVPFSNSGNHARQQQPSRARGLVQGCLQPVPPPWSRHAADTQYPAGTRIVTPISQAGSAVCCITRPTTTICGPRAVRLRVQVL